MPLWIRRRRDPFWEIDGPAARREHKRTRVMEMIAFSYATLAIGATIAAWAVQLGLAHGHGVRLLIVH